MKIKSSPDSFTKPLRIERPAAQKMPETGVKTPRADTPQDAVEISTITTSAKRPAGPKLEAFRQWAQQYLPGPVGGVVDAAIGLACQETRDCGYKSSREFETEAQAKEAFQKAEERILNPDSWYQMGMTNVVTGQPFGPNYGLRDSEGKAKAGVPKEGDHLEIKLPFQPRRSWVEVESLERAPQRTELLVRPSPNPRRKDKPEVSHMHSDRTTNSFLLSQDGKTLSMEISAVDEDLNLEGSIFAKLQNIANLGVGWAGVKESLWAKSVNSILDGPPEHKSFMKMGLDSALRVATLGKRA